MSLDYKLKGYRKKLQGLQKKPFDTDKLKLKKRLLNQTSKIEKKKNTRVNVTHTKPEKLVKEILKNNGIKFIQEYQLMNKFYDFFLSDFNILLEIDGEYWHGKDTENISSMQLKNRIEDWYKTSLAAIKQLPLVRIWESEITEAYLLKKIEEAKKEKFYTDENNKEIS